MGAASAIIALVVLGTTAWVGADASNRDWSNDRFADATWKWVLGCLLLWIVVFPMYLARRGSAGTAGGNGNTGGKVRERERTPGVFWWGIGSCAAMALGAFGPWAHVLGVSVGGTDGTNDGWIVLGLALLA